MSDWPESKPTNSVVISTISPESLGSAGRTNVASNSNSVTWPVANLAIFVPVIIYQPLTILKMSVINGATASGFIDVGIYDVNGARLISSGSTAQVGTVALQIFDITDTLLLPGLYYIAAAMDNTTGTLSGVFGAPSVTMELLGCLQKASGFPLPSSTGFGVYAQTFVPHVALHTQITI